MTIPGYNTVDPYSENEAKHRLQLAEAINNILAGRLNVTADLTLNASAATTTIMDARISYYSFIYFMPTTANAATALASIYVDGFKNGQATINHASNSATDQTFKVLIIG